MDTHGSRLGACSFLSNLWQRLLATLNARLNFVFNVFLCFVFVSLVVYFSTITAVRLDPLPVFAQHMLRVIPVFMIERSNRELSPIARVQNSSQLTKSNIAKPIQPEHVQQTVVFLPTEHTPPSPTPALNKTTTSTFDVNLQFRFICANNCLAFAETGGRMGNYMFRYATTIGVALLTNRTAITDDTTFKNYAQWFLNITIVHGPVTNLLQGFEVIGLNKAVYYYPDIYERLQAPRNFKMSGFLQSYKYFDNFSDTIKNEYRFKQDIYDAAFKQIQLILEQLNVTRSEITLVGIHVRRGDFLDADKQNFGYYVGSQRYILRAMNYISAVLENDKKPSPVFLMVGQDMLWMSKFARKVNESEAGFVLKVLRPQTPAIDMCLLTVCDHMILTVGTFGWWSAYLNPGMKIYQRQAVKPGTSLANEFNYDDFFPPSWIGLNM